MMNCIVNNLCFKISVHNLICLGLALLAEFIGEYNKQQLFQRDVLVIFVKKAFCNWTIKKKS